MNPTLPALVAFAFVFAGCLDAAPAEAPPSSGIEAAPAPIEPETLAWKGEILASPLDAASHQRPTEDILWPVNKVGFLMEVPDVPKAYEVSLDWTDMRGGRMMIMLHSHKAHGTNVYVEHITPYAAKGPICLRVPVEDLADGEWQVMVHTQDVVRAQFTLTVNLWGTAGKVVPNTYHGHHPEDGAFSVDKHKIEECTGQL